LRFGGRYKFGGIDWPVFNQCRRGPGRGDRRHRKGSILSDRFFGGRRDGTLVRKRHLGMKHARAADGKKSKAPAASSNNGQPLAGDGWPGSFFIVGGLMARQKRAAVIRSPPPTMSRRWGARAKPGGVCAFQTRYLARQRFFRDRAISFGKARGELTFSSPPPKKTRPAVIGGEVTRTAQRPRPGAAAWPRRTSRMRGIISRPDDQVRSFINRATSSLVDGAITGAGPANWDPAAGQGYVSAAQGNSIQGA